VLPQSKLRKYSLYFLSLLWSSPGFLASAVPSMLCGFFRSWLLILAAGLLSLLLFLDPFRLLFQLLPLAAVLFGAADPGRRRSWPPVRGFLFCCCSSSCCRRAFVPGRRSFVSWLFAAVGPGCRPFVCFFVPGFLFSSGS